MIKILALNIFADIQQKSTDTLCASGSFGIAIFDNSQNMQSFKFQRFGRSSTVTLATSRCVNSNISYRNRFQAMRPGRPPARPLSQKISTTEGGESILYAVLMSGESIPTFPTPLVQTQYIRKFKLPWRESLKNIRIVFILRLSLFILQKSKLRISISVITNVFIHNSNPIWRGEN